ncbi:MAG: CvpA family protein [Lachnospiraceae bacterium]|nr:CvpA family protein [Lachnospiraceae bacterium]
MYYAALIIIALIFIWRMVVGFKKGMVQELISLVAMAVAGVCVVLILGAIGSYLDKEIAQVVKMVAVLLAVCLVYRLVNVLFTSLQLIAKLPIVRWLDKVLGIAVGFAEAGLMVMVFIHVLKNWGLSIL